MSPRLSEHRPVGTRRAAVSVVSAVAVLLAIALPVLALRTDPEPDKPCHPDHGTGLLTEYDTTVNMPADSSDWWVSVTFTLVDDGQTPAACELSLATYELPSNELTFPQTLHDADGGVFGAGTHTLTAALPREGELPGCWFQYDFVFGPALDTVTSGSYGDRQIRARISGTESCTLNELGGTPTPTPRDSELGGNPTPTPGDLPDTATSGLEGQAPATVLSLVLVGSLATLFYLRRARQRR